MWKGKEEVYCFENFIVGNANESAYRKAKTFVEPLSELNLLFVHGNVGNGKTHLAKAVEYEFLLQNKLVKMLKSDEFVGELIWYLGQNMEKNSMEAFCKEYEQFDALLLDDLHFLEGKETTQQYFAYLLARLSMKKKKVMITSVKELSEYSWLNDALNKNKTQVVQVSIEDADDVLKKDILEKLQKEWKYELSQECVDMLVCQAKNIRELEGYFKRMMAYYQLMGVEHPELI